MVNTSLVCNLSPHPSALYDAAKFSIQVHGFMFFSQLVKKINYNPKEIMMLFKVLEIG